MAVSAPTCRICQVAHWSTEGHQFPKSAKADPKAERVAKVREQVAAIVAVDKPAKFDKRAYQKVYMAKRRLKA